jgi:hypothetical protein
VKNAIFAVIRSEAASSAAADLGDQDDLALGLERGEIGVLIDLTVDRYRHAFVDLVTEAWEAAVELEDQAADRVRLDLEFGQPAAERARCLIAGRSSRSRRCRGFALGPRRRGS